jgi:hypothetical protein
LGRLLLRIAQRLGGLALRDFTFVLNLRFKLLRFRRNELGKSLAHSGLRRDIGDPCWRSSGGLDDGWLRGNDSGQAGVVYYPFRQFLVGTNAHYGLVDRRNLIARHVAGHRRLLRREGIKREDQREQHSADIQEISRYGHWNAPPAPRAVIA